MSPEATFGQGITVVKPDAYSPNGIPVVKAGFVEQVRLGLRNEQISHYKIDECGVILLKPPSDRFRFKYGLDQEWSAFMQRSKLLLATYAIYSGPQIPLVSRVELFDISPEEIDRGIEEFKEFNPDFCGYTKELLQIPYVFIEQKGTRRSIQIPPATDMALSMFGLMEAKAARDKAQK